MLLACELAWEHIKTSCESLLCTEQDTDTVPLVWMSFSVLINMGLALLKQNGCRGKYNGTSGNSMLFSEHANLYEQPLVVSFNSDLH